MWHTMRSIVEAISGFVGNRQERAPEATSNHEGSGHSITMIALLAEDRDRSVIADLCYDNHWQVFFAATFEGALRTLDQVKPQIVLFDRDLAGASWRTVVSSFAASWAGACIMLVSRVVDDYLWNEVVCNGGYDVLPKPLREDEVCRVVKLAWCYWSSAVKSPAASRK